MSYSQFPYIAYPDAPKRGKRLLVAAVLAAATVSPVLGETIARSPGVQVAQVPPQRVAQGAPPAPNGYSGVWYDDTGDGAIEINACGPNLCGRIVWLKNQIAPDGGMLTDIYNPDPKNKRRPICGLDIIGNLKRQSDGTWDAGWIYDPKQGKSYDVALSLQSANVLSVTGYMGSKFLSQTFAWKRAPADLGRCIVIMPSAPGPVGSTTGARN